MINIEEVKNEIMGILNQQGPSIPIRISKQLKIEPMLASAILSELLSERRIITSNMRIGSSPLYLLPGQENQIEKFIDNISGVQKTALLKLKQNKILEDEKQEPAIRVALRSLKDFAVPLRFQEKIIWKYFTVENKEIQETLERGTKKPIPEISKDIPEVKNKEKPILQIKEKRNIKRSVKNEKFFEEVKDFLLKKDIEFLRELETSKKEILAVVRINSDLGKLNLLLVAKDKKRISEADLTMAYQKSMEEKMPCLFISYGEPSKKTNEFLADYKDVIKLRRIE